MQSTNTILKEKINIEDMIYEIRGRQVIIDSDLAKLYHVTTGNLNKAVKRNIERFPEYFMFQLTKEEFKILMFQIGTSNKREDFSIEFSKYREVPVLVGKSSLRLLDETNIEMQEELAKNMPNDKEISLVLTEKYNEAENDFHNRYNNLMESYQREAYMMDKVRTLRLLLTQDKDKQEKNSMNQSE